MPSSGKELAGAFSRSKSRVCELLVVKAPHSLEQILIARTPEPEAGFFRTLGRWRLSNRT